ncbi:MAG: hypothetical protein MJB14_13285 [Spirochaetes bacterium]|nr:hypothetical protein [Spirochaetota bacterium]
MKKLLLIAISVLLFSCQHFNESKTRVYNLATTNISYIYVGSSSFGGVYTNNKSSVQYIRAGTHKVRGLFTDATEITETEIEIEWGGCYTVIVDNDSVSLELTGIFKYGDDSDNE